MTDYVFLTFCNSMRDFCTLYGKLSGIFLLSIGENGSNPCIKQNGFCFIDVWGVFMIVVHKVKSITI